MKRIIVLISALLISVAAFSQIRLPAQIGDYMVLQQNTDAAIWGWAPEGTGITVTTSWDKVRYTAKAESDGFWKLRVRTPSGDYDEKSFTISDGKNSVTISHVLIGEVWLASGQSNMEMTLAGFANCPVEGALQDIAESGRYKGKIRYSTVPQTVAYSPIKTSGEGWKECVADNAPSFGATAYYFAKNLSDVLDVPIGIVNNAWGGSKVEGWLPREEVAKYPDMPSDSVEVAKIFMAMSRPTIMYYGQWTPVRDYTYKGVIWYQGESNLGDPAKYYADRMTTLINLWRKENGAQLPVYMVEIAPYALNGDLSGSEIPLLREQQHKVTTMVSDAYIISTADLVLPYEANQIHPAKKREVGQRLSYLALNHTYGKKIFPGVAPTFGSIDFEGDKVVVNLDHLQETGGLNRLEGIEGFEVCGADLVWREAEAQVVNMRNLILVGNDMISEPVAVRYAFRNFLPGNLAGANGLAVPPFRSDRLFEGEIPSRKSIYRAEEYVGKWTGSMNMPQMGGMPLSIDLLLEKVDDETLSYVLNSGEKGQVKLGTTKISVPGFDFGGFKMPIDLRPDGKGGLSVLAMGRTMMTLQK